MNKLLSANFSRLWKSKLFWGSLLFMSIMGVFMPVMRYKEMIQYNTTYKIDDTLFYCAILISIVSAILCSLFIGTEYSDGTIRNKIIAGHSRASIYLSNLFTVATASIILCSTFFIMHICIGGHLLGDFGNNKGVILILIVCVYFLAVALCSIFCLFSMLIQNKTTASITAIVISLVLLIIGTGMFSSLYNEPKMIPANTSTNGSPMYDVDTPNPKYLEGTKRKAYEFFYNFLPGGQVVQFTCMQVSNPYMLSSYSGIIILITTGVGVNSFKRKDIK
ncbi:ABC transporter permease subunit [Clostridioides difficile]|nr:ABC transporter permease subunit [Clostridioides difficile]